MHHWWIPPSGMTLVLYAYMQFYRPSEWSYLPSVKALSNRSADWGKWRRKSGHIPPPPEWWQKTWNHGTWRNKLMTYHMQRRVGGVGGGGGGRWTCGPWDFRREVSNPNVSLYSEQQVDLSKVLKTSDTCSPLSIQVEIGSFTIVKPFFPPSLPSLFLLKAEECGFTLLTYDSYTNIPFVTCVSIFPQPWQPSGADQS